MIFLFLPISINLQAEESLSNNGSKVLKIEILFLGDSLTEGFGVEPEESFPTLVDEMLKDRGYKTLEIINAGISGSTTASAVSRLKWYLKNRAKPKQGQKSDILFLALGANDGLRGLSLKAMEENLNSTIEIALDAKMEVILAGMEIPPNYGEKYTQDFRAVFKELATRHKISLMPYLLKDVGGFYNLNQPDGVHPNADGYKIVAKNVLPYILEKL
ncbi:MAG: arylesterase [Desulfamplus sp.]|nr:arylesterase [Desulfamplus sp.]MBF0390912.1 arylesterase [Desulfamplus sp.]